MNPEQTILFFGDSITDAGRDRGNLASLGSGYVSQIQARLGLTYATPDLTVLNLGISGNRVDDLVGRLDSDVIAHNPGTVTFLIGINDVWRQFDSGLVSDLSGFQSNYAQMLTRLRDETDADIVLMEPFLLPVPIDRRSWRAILDERIAVVRDLAVEFGATLIPLDGMFAVAATRAPAEFWLPDGVHPTPAGHALIADAWLGQIAGV